MRQLARVRRGAEPVGKRSKIRWRTIGLTISIIAAVVGLALENDRIDQRDELRRGLIDAREITSDEPKITKRSAKPSARLRTDDQRTVSGTVRDSRGHGLVGGQVCALHPDDEGWNPLCVETLAGGRFTLPESAIGLDTLVASAPGYLPKRISVPVSSGLVDVEATLDIVLARGGLAVAGRVLDALGGTIPGARVNLTSADEITWYATSVTAADGSFEMVATSPDVEVQAAAEGYSTDRFKARAPFHGLTLVLGPEALLRGRVVDASTGEPVAGVPVTVEAFPAADERPRRGVSDQQGEFRVSGLRGGRYYSVAAANGEWGGAQSWASLAVGEQSDSVLLRVHPATSLQATVSRGVRPCAGASVALMGPVGAAAESDSDGRVSIEGLLPGRYEVALTCPGALPSRDVIEIGDGPVARRWTLSDGLSVSGLVLSPAGRRIPHVMLSVVPVGDSVSERMPVNCKTDESGEFLCAGLFPGQYEFEIADTGGGQRERLRIELRDESIDGLRLQANGVGTIHAVVRATEAALPKDIKVFARQGYGLPVSGTFDGASEFAFDSLPIGQYRVYVESPMADSTADVTLEREGQVVTVNLAAPSTLSITGSAFDALGEPWVDAWVVVTPADPNTRSSDAPYPRALTGGNGEFSLNGLAPGLYDLSVNDAAGQASTRHIRAGAKSVTVREEIDVVSRVE